MASEFRQIATALHQQAEELSIYADQIDDDDLREVAVKEAETTRRASNKMFVYGLPVVGFGFFLFDLCTGQLKDPED